MSHQIEHWMYLIGQMFLIPTLAAIGLLFVYSLIAFGSFAMAWWQRRNLPIADAAKSHSRAYPLVALAYGNRLFTAMRGIWLRTRCWRLRAW